MVSCEALCQCHAPHGEPRPFLEVSVNEIFSRITNSDLKFTKNYSWQDWARVIILHYARQGKDKENSLDIRESGD